jgi:hypothetical protein
MAVRVLFLCLVLPAFFLPAEEPAKPAELNAEQQAKAIALCKQLGSDEFDARERAVKELAAMGAPVVPLLKEALKNADDPEVKTRMNQIVDQLDRDARVGRLIAEADGDPEKLFMKGRQLRAEGKAKDASDIFRAAAEVFRKKAAENDDANIKRMFEARAQACDVYARTADSGKVRGAVNNQIIVGNGVRVINGGQIRIQVQGGADSDE